MKAYAICVGLLIGLLGSGLAGYKLGAGRWQHKYDALVSDGWEATAREYKRQLDRSIETAHHNTEVMSVLERKNRLLDADRDRLRGAYQRLLAYAAPGSGGVPQAPSIPGTAGESPKGRPGEVAGLLGDATTECDLNANQLDALIDEIAPQL